MIKPPKTPALLLDPKVFKRKKVPKPPNERKNQTFNPRLNRIVFRNNLVGSPVIYIYPP